MRAVFCGSMGRIPFCQNAFGRKDPVERYPVFYFALFAIKRRCLGGRFVEIRHDEILPPVCQLVRSQITLYIFHVFGKRYRSVIIPYVRSRTDVDRRQPFRHAIIRQFHLLFVIIVLRGRLRIVIPLQRIQIKPLGSDQNCNLMVSYRTLFVHHYRVSVCIHHRISVGVNVLFLVCFHQYGLRFSVIKYVV